MDLFWVTREGRSDFCGELKPMEGYLKAEIDDSLSFQLTSNEALSLYDQLHHRIRNRFENEKVLFIDEGDFKTLTLRFVNISLSEWQVDELRSELERVLALGGSRRAEIQREIERWMRQRTEFQCHDWKTNGF